MHRYKDKTPIEAFPGDVTFDKIIQRQCHQLCNTSNVQRIFENDDWIIDLMVNEDGSPMLRVSVFKDGHFLDEEFVRKKDYLD